VNREEDTYQTTFEKAYAEFLGDREDKKPENFRIRMFNLQSKIKLETFRGREAETLESLRIFPLKVMLLEEKGEQEEFEDYDPNSMEVKVNLWRDGLVGLTEELLEPVTLKAKKDMTMTDLQVLICTKFNLQTKPDDLLIMKRNPMLNIGNLDILSTQGPKPLTQLRISDGVNLFCEDATTCHPSTPKEDNQPMTSDLNPESKPSHTPKWEVEFELDQNRFHIKVNDPKDSESLNNQTSTEHNAALYKHSVIVDRRSTVLDLKLKIADYFRFSLSEVVFRRGGSHGSELIEDDDSLKMAQFYSNICVYTEKGVPSQVG
jgi:hypothetical protein